MTMNEEESGEPFNQGRMKGRAPRVAAITWWAVAVMFVVGCTGVMLSLIAMAWKAQWSHPALWTCIWLTVLGIIFAGLRENLFGQSGKPWDGHDD